MKNIVITILIILFGCQEQVNPDLGGKCYTCFISNEFSCSLNLYQDTKYELLLIYTPSDDLVDSYLISSGFFVVNHTNLTLVDEAFDYEMKFKIKGKYLHTKKTLKFLNSSYFEEFADSIPDGDLKLPFDKVRLHKEIDSIKNSRQNIIPFAFGKYKYYPIQIDINKFNQYHLSMFDMTISEGKWYRLNNLIILHDKYIDSDFFLVTDTNVIQGKYLPMTRYDTKLLIDSIYNR